MKKRLYIDEVGDPGLKSAHIDKHRYLSLTGVIFDIDYVDKVVFQELEDIKRKYFEYHVDDPIIFHRKEIVNRKYPFHVLKNPHTRNSFDSDLINLLSGLEYTVITVIIDKLEHREKYRVWHLDSYHYCMRILLERYLLYLKSVDSRGDVMAESRGGKEDMRLKKSYKKAYDEGTEYIGAEAFGKHITSLSLKVKQKLNNIPGLQIADLLAHPCHNAAISLREGQKWPERFGGRLAKIVEESKYYRSPQGRIDGWGRKWLP